MDPSRRHFLTSTGLTLTVALSASMVPIFSWSNDEYATNSIDSNGGGVVEYLSWITLENTGEVIITLGKTELGQGIHTSLGMVIADEMDADWQQVSLKMGLAQKQFFDLHENEQSTIASSSIRHLYAGLRKAGAAMKAMLVQAAAHQWQIPPAFCQGQLHQIVNVKNGDINYGKTLGYGELVQYASQQPLPCCDDIILKQPSDFRYIGTSVPRDDLEQKLVGNAEFGFDIFIDDMLYAQVLRPPRFGAKLLSYNKTVAFEIPNQSLAVCAASLYEVFNAVKQTNAIWDQGTEPDLNNQTLQAQLTTAYQQDKSWVTHLQWGDMSKLSAETQRSFMTPYYHHATLETPTCVAYVQDHLCEIWAPTQIQTRNLISAMKITGLPEAKIKLNTTYVGGGFGRKSYGDFVDEAIVISNILRCPIKLFWSREDDIRHGIYLSSSMAKVNAQLDRKKQKIAHWQHQIAVDPILWDNGQKDIHATMEGIFAAPPNEQNTFLYQVENFSVRYCHTNRHVPIGYFRGVGYIHNVFAVETVIDELAYEHTYLHTLTKI